MRAMRIRTQLYILTVIVITLPIFVAGLIFFITGIKSIVPLNPRAQITVIYQLEKLSRATMNLDRFLKAASGIDPELAVLVEGTDGTQLFPMPGSPAAEKRADSSRRTDSGDTRTGSTSLLRYFEIGGYGEVRVTMRSDPSLTGSGVEPLILVTGFLFLLLIAGEAMIARSLSTSFRILETSTARLRAGDLDTPVELPSNRDLAGLAATLESLRASLKEEQARRSRLMLGISHDFRTPIALIRGYAESLLGGVAKNRDAELRYLGIISDKTGQLDALVEELLDYARTETDQRRAAKVPSDLVAFFSGLAAEFAEDAGLGGRKFSFRNSTEGTAVAPLDSRLARRAFENIFSNAMRYTEPGGFIEMELERTAADRFVASISDNGLGVSPEDAPWIFEPLYRGHNVGKRRGSGLGLSVVKSVMEGQGWEIVCSPKAGGGTRFLVNIPLDRQTPAV
ncbi:MAG: HAMP domain-containing sensor histidine kinase [Rectinemataceae bacterium]|nr:HAMP domain-containing sensor histidine kinase [Rectinemataceae bacterium]